MMHLLKFIYLGSIKIKSIPLKITIGPAKIFPIALSDADITATITVASANPNRSNNSIAKNVTLKKVTNHK